MPYPWDVQKVFDDITAHVLRLLPVLFRVALEQVGCVVTVVASAVGVGAETAPHRGRARRQRQPKQGGREDITIHKEKEPSPRPSQGPAS